MRRSARSSPLDLLVRSSASLAALLLQIVCTPNVTSADQCPSSIIIRSYQQIPDIANHKQFSCLMFRKSSKFHEFFRYGVRVTNKYLISEKNSVRTVFIRFLHCGEYRVEFVRVILYRKRHPGNEELSAQSRHKLGHEKERTAVQDVSLPQGHFTMTSSFCQ